jgi:hypothetical protein
MHQMTEQESEAAFRQLKANVCRRVKEAHDLAKKRLAPRTLVQAPRSTRVKSKVYDWDIALKQGRPYHCIRG